MSKQNYSDPYAKRPTKADRAAQAQGGGAPWRMRNMNPYMKRRIRTTYLVIAVLLIGAWYIAGHYGYWFGFKTEDGFRIDEDAPTVACQWTESSITDKWTGENIVYTPVISEFNFAAGEQEQTVAIGNHPDSVYFLAFVIRATSGQEGVADKEVYRSQLYGQGQGIESLKLQVGFDEGDFPISIEYRYYYHFGGMLHYITSVTQAATVHAVYQEGTERRDDLVAK